jgi:glucan 1,3-beta-glucosidase
MATLSIFTIFFLFLLVSSAPTATPAVADTGASSYWLASIPRNGTVPFGTAGYQVFRNVKDFGAKGDGTSPSSWPINCTNSQTRNHR